MITYLLKSSACIAIVYLVYLVFFKYTDKFQVNRAYLLMGLVLSFIVPVIAMPATSMDVITTVMNDEFIAGDIPEFPITTGVVTGHSVIMYLYYSGVAVAFLLTLISVVRLFWNKSIHQPFSFLGSLFVKAGEDPVIIEHEMVHIRQRHWIDLVLAEAACIVLWFNPFTYFYRRSIAIQHEYIADRHVISRVPVKAYLDCLTRHLESNLGAGLINSFTAQPIKQRIIMMTSVKSYSVFRYVVLFPLVVFVMMAFSMQNRELRSPVDVGKLKAGEAVGFGSRIHPKTKKESFHTGVDFRLGAGNSVYAAGSGEVVTAARSGDYGNLVIIRHNKTLTTYYAHLEKIIIRKGDKVDAGQLIGTVGSSGLSTGPHLHFEVLENLKAVDPVPYLNMSVD